MTITMIRTNTYRNFMGHRVLDYNTFYIRNGKIVNIDFKPDTVHGDVFAEDEVTEAEIMKQIDEYTDYIENGYQRTQAEQKNERIRKFLEI